MAKFRALIYWTAAILGLLAYFFPTERASRPEEKSLAVQSKDLRRQPATQTPSTPVKDPKKSFVSIETDRILDWKESKETDGRTRRIALLERPRFKYPLLVSEQVLDAAGNVVSRREMVADHLMVRLKDSVRTNEFEQDLRRLGGRIQPMKENSKIYLVFFDGTSLGALQKMKQEIIQTGKVQFAEEDRIVHLPRNPAKSL